MKFNTNPVRGTVDYLPEEMEVVSYAKQIILDIYKKNGFLQIKTPILESLELLTNGDSGDNQKLMFKTVKRGEKLDLTKPNLTENDIVEEGLRYDLTVPLVRLFSNNIEKLPIPFKSIQIDDAFRAERPQRGRVRQFTQCDIDILGDASPMAEVELLTSYAQAYKSLGFDKIQIKINDRRLLNELITKAGFEEGQVQNICISLDKFDKIGREGVVDELVSNGYEKEKVDAVLVLFDEIKNAKTNQDKLKIIEKMQINHKIVDSLREIIESIEKFLVNGQEIVLDVSVIRGQGYYTGTVFEVFDSSFGRAIGGGGRYDKMVEKFTGNSIPAVGCSIGLYSVVMLMIERGFKPQNAKLAIVYTKESIVDVIETKQKLIKQGYNVSAFAFPKNFNNFLSRLKASGYTKLVKMADTNKIIEI